MQVVRATPGPVLEVDLDGEALTAWLAEQYRIRAPRWVRLNLISAIGGAITGPSGTSADLSAGIDLPLLLTLRDAADVVLVGASSVRASRYPVPKRAVLAVATAGGALTAADLPSAAPGRVLVLCPVDAAEGLAAELGDRVEIVAVDAAGDPAALIGALRARGFDRILCEGGGRLATELLAAGVVTELCLAGAPLIGSTGPRLIARDLPLTPVRLDLLLLDPTGRTYARWVLPSAASSGG